MTELALITLASLLAGCIDAIVGGGGLILVPALFATYPTATPATLFGTNKGAAIWGTMLAAWRYARRVELRWGTWLPAIGAALAGSLLGAWAVTTIDARPLRIALPFVLLALLLYTLARKDMGQSHAPRHAPGRERLLACLVGLAIGFYDGLFGPGTGSFFVFLFVRLLGFDFLHASAAAKLMNTATNASALALFAATGNIWWGVALLLAAANMVGSVIGTHLALKKGAGFVRWVFIGVVALLIGKTGLDAWRLI
ncbi:sulfite exporter TauE/SafE family protein [Inhella sp.]|uniref:sulfite exporter TauE/SafE family protein n=1 Tax=Inhella sp. TaxID=1921806 RepID=UPI0035B0AA12